MADDRPVPVSASEPAQESTTSIGRRGLLRGGAVLAGATVGATVLALAAEPAHAADGEAVEIGAANEGDTTTTLTIGGEDGSEQPTLSLQNANGPTLKLQPLPFSWAGELQVGEMIGTDLGPEVGVEGPLGLVKTPIATWLDLAEIASPFPTNPSRVLDLRTTAGRDAIVRRSAADAVAADGKLRAGQWIDVSVLLTGDDYDLQAVFVNLTVVGPQRSGHAILHAPGVQPPTSNLNFAVGQTVGNSAFVGTGVVQGHHAVRLFTRVDAWYVIDVTGGVGIGTTQPPLRRGARARAGARPSARGNGRQAAVAKMRRAIERSAR